MKRAIAVVAFVAATIPATDALAAPRDAGAPLASSAGGPKKQPEVLGFYRGRTVKYFDFGPIRLKPGNKVAPIWTFTNGADGQRNIIDTVPGRADYSPLWRVNEVTWASGATPRVLRSAAEVRQAVAAGEATVERTRTVVNCPVLGFGQVRHPGFSRGKTIHYYELGEVRVAAGNEVVPLWAFTNGASGQRNVADVTPGQTAYPPLWAIVQVTWKAGVKPRVLRSYAQIRRARAAGQLRLRKTSMVVNCPLV
jgi:hypothetical protein